MRRIASSCSGGLARRNRFAGVANLFGRIAFIGLVALVVAPVAGSAPVDGRPLRIATTASLERSGLLAVLLRDFVAQSGHSVRIIGRGTVAAMAFGRRGEADIVLSPASPEERALLKSGVAFSRRPFLESRFVIAGPKADPAGVARAKNPEQAITQIFRLRAPFVRRADDSDVRAQERMLFTAAHLDPEKRWETLVENTAGMVDALEVAGRNQAYVVADLAAFLAARSRTGLVELSHPAADLRQVYSILRLDAERVDSRAIHDEAAFALEQFLISDRAQQAIRDFRVAGATEVVFVPLILDGVGRETSAGGRSGRGSGDADAGDSKEEAH
ncbi:substrate-binding domain-containing protein [Myxococcota bacterium]|nr:substrate-binding domain-containing protein [Myxococcota bacterium]